MVEIFPKVNVFVGRNSILRHHHIQNITHGIQFPVYKINKESVAYFSQFISVKVKTFLRKSQAQFSRKVKKTEAQEKCRFSYKKTCSNMTVQNDIVMGYNVCLNEGNLKNSHGNMA